MAKVGLVKRQGTAHAEVWWWESGPQIHGTAGSSFITAESGVWSGWWVFKAEAGDMGRGQTHQVACRPHLDSALRNTETHRRTLREEVMEVDVQVSSKARGANIGDRRLWPRSGWWSRGHEAGWRGDEGVKSTGLGDLCDKDWAENVTP